MTGTPSATSGGQDGSFQKKNNLYVSLSSLFAPALSPLSLSLLLVFAFKSIYIFGEKVLQTSR